MRQFAVFSGLVALLALVLSLAPGVAAADPSLEILETRTDGYPQVTIKFSPTNSVANPASFRDRDLVVEENGQKAEPLIVHRVRQEAVPLAIALTVDTSGSMNDEEKLKKAKAAAKSFVGGLRPIDRVEVVAFSDRIATVLPFTNDRTAIGKAIDGLTANGDTAMYDALYQALNDVARAEGTRLVVLLTDGEDTASKTRLEQPLGLAAQQHVPVYTIGLGKDVKDDVLGRIAAESKGRYFKAPKPDDLTTAFRGLSQQIANEYEVSYYSPLDLDKGAKVDVVVRLANGSPSDAPLRFSYTVSRTKAEQRAATASVARAIDPGQLRPVVEPTPTPRPESQPLPANWAEIASLVGATGVLILFAGFGLSMNPNATETRLATYVESTTRALGRRRRAPGRGRVVMMLARWLAGRVAHFFPARQLEQMRRNLILAGNPYGWGVEEMLGIRILLALVLGVYFYVILAPRGQMNAILYGVLIGAVGFLLPSIWLSRKIKARQHEVFRAMPNALDLLAVSVEAGLGFDQALAEVCRKWHNALTREFDVLLAELQMGRPRREALRGLMDRTGVPELGGFASALIQADELGASIANTLTVQAEQIRLRRRLRAEEQAHQAAIKMLFPLVFLMLPALFVVILGPAIPQIAAGFSQIGR